MSSLAVHVTQQAGEVDPQLRTVAEPALSGTPIEHAFGQAWEHLQAEVNATVAEPSLSDADENNLVHIFKVTHAERKAYKDPQDVPEALNRICDSSIERIQQAHTKIVEIYAAKYAGVVEAVEIHGEAALILVEAALNFDADRSQSFRRYFNTLLPNRLIDAIRDGSLGNGARIPRSAKRLSRMIKDAGLMFHEIKIVDEKDAAQIEAEINLSPAERPAWTEQELADTFGVSLASLKDFIVRRSLLNISSVEQLTQSTTRDNASQAATTHSTAFLADKESETIPHSALRHLIEQVVLDNTYEKHGERTKGRFYAGHWIDDPRIMKKMRIPPRTMEAFCMYYGLLERPHLSMTEISPQLGVTVARVSQMCHEAADAISEVIKSMPGSEQLFQEMLA
jgi:DNA-directed RNA polymerase specialized sigma subunit